MYSELTIFVSRKSGYRNGQASIILEFTRSILCLLISTSVMFLIILVKQKSRYLFILISRFNWKRKASDEAEPNGKTTKWQETILKESRASKSKANLEAEGNINESRGSESTANVEAEGNTNQDVALNFQDAALNFQDVALNFQDVALNFQEQRNRQKKRKC